MALPYSVTQIRFFIKIIQHTTYLALFLMSNIATFAQAETEQIRVGSYFKDISQYPYFQRIGSTTINLHYAIYHLKTPENYHLLVSSKFEDDYSRVNDYHLRVIDIENITPFKEEYFSIKVKGCELNGKLDSSVFALVVNENKRYLTKVLKVWKVDRKTGTISVSNNNDSVRCLNENYAVALSEY